MPKPIVLSTDSPDDVTVIPNLFFDDYMPRANGEFLKIYLYLLRWLPGPDDRLSLDRIADTFFMTENDICRALRYWEQAGLLSLTCDSDGSITAICMKAVQPRSGTAASRQAPAPTAGRPADTPAAPQSGRHAAQSVQTGSAQTGGSSGSAVSPPGARSYSMQTLQHFTQSSDGEQLIFIIQQYLGHPLSQTELNTIYFFYDDLGFSADLIEYLFEYCVSNGHTHIRYIEKVALAWADQHITTADEARTQSEAHQRTCFAVLKAFGLGGRMPTAGEVDYVNKWTRTYGFTMELILEACRRTMMAVHTPSFEYTDKILSNWKTLGAYTMTEVLAADKARSSRPKPAAPGNTARPPKTSSNKFHNFKQRSYDYEALEKKLAQKVQAASSDTP